MVPDDPKMNQPLGSCAIDLIWNLTLFYFLTDGERGGGQE